jgi:polysaccharide biosynthesis/export protein
MNMSKYRIVPRLNYLGLIAWSIFAVNLLFSVSAVAQDQPSTSRKRVVKEQEDGKATVGVESHKPVSSSETAGEEQMFKDVLRRFSDTYRFGPADAIAIRVKGQPDYSLERVKISPMGTIYHPLLGDLSIAGLTMDQLKKQLMNELSEYILDPIVSIELLEAQSAKIGVIGDVKVPRVIVMTGPMTILDAITEAGGIADTGSRSGVILSRQNFDGSRVNTKVNIKNIMDGKARAEDNLALQAGDMVIVPGNFMKKVPIISSITGFASLLSLIQLGAKK